MSIPCICKAVVRFSCAILALGGTPSVRLLGQPWTEVVVPKPSPRELSRINQHVANSARTPAPEPGQENTPILSPLIKLDGQRVTTASEWYRIRRPELLTSWSLMRNYRNGTTSRTGAPDLLYERFGHWLPIARMAYDIRREAEYLKTRREVDGTRIGFIGFSHSAKAAVYGGAFAPEIKAIVAVDPHIAINGGTNYYDRWYLSWRRRFEDIHTDDYPIPELRGTVQSLLNPDPDRPGFERDHHELLSMAAPRPFLLIGGSQSEARGDSD